MTDNIDEQMPGLIAAIQAQADRTIKKTVAHMAEFVARDIAKRYENMEAPLEVHGEMVSDYPTEDIAAAVTYTVTNNTATIYLDKDEAVEAAQKYAAYMVAGNPFLKVRTKLRDLPEFRQRYAGL